MPACVQNQRRTTASITGVVLAVLEAAVRKYRNFVPNAGPRYFRYGVFFLDPAM